MIENEVMKVIDSRRSIRAYKDTPLKQEEINTIVYAAMRAPTAGNMMHYSIIEVRDQEKKEVLVKTCDNQPLIVPSESINPCNKASL